jgi:hypothetical protein
VKGQHGGAAAVGPHGGVAARGPHGGHAAGRYHGGHYYARPAWGAASIGAFGRPYAGYPAWRAYGTWGLAAGLATVSSLAFLSSGLLIGTYAAEERTVYVYVVEEDGVQMEYRVDEQGNILSKRPVSEPQ